MRLGVNYTPQHETPEEWGDILVKMGCRAASFPGNESMPDHVIDAYVKAARERDILIAEVGVWDSPFVPDRAQAEAAAAKAKAKLALADYVQARCCVNVSGAFGPIWAMCHRDNFGPEAFVRVKEYIQGLLEEVKPQHTYFTLEPMQWMVPDSPEQYVEILDAVNHPRFAVHMDAINFNKDPYTYTHKKEVLDRAFALLGPRNIRSCHVKDCLLEPGITVCIREVPIGSGTMEIDYYLEKISCLDPDMPVLVEHQQTMEEYQAALDYLKPKIAAFS